MSDDVYFDRRVWPATPRTFANELRRVQPVLLTQGIQLEFDRSGRSRNIFVRRVDVMRGMEQGEGRGMMTIVTMRDAGFPTLRHTPSACFATHLITFVTLVTMNLLFSGVGKEGEIERLGKQASPASRASLARTKLGNCKSARVRKACWARPQSLNESEVN